MKIISATLAPFIIHIDGLEAKSFMSIFSQNRFLIVYCVNLGRIFDSVKLYFTVVDTKKLPVCQICDFEILVSLDSEKIGGHFD